MDQVRKLQEELSGGMARSGGQATGSRSDNEERYALRLPELCFALLCPSAMSVSRRRCVCVCRQREANKRLRRLLEEERKALKQVRQNYANELRHRTEMEMLLRSCVEDVRNEISRR